MMVNVIYNNVLLIMYCIFTKIVINKQWGIDALVTINIGLTQHNIAYGVVILY